ncbi:hypothetical protein [Methylocystis sp.]|uniref:hypothetical protein n=1 Tax=Methylocystis sp. TaxID=1911079 RepID=UPI003DA34EE9
MNEITAVSATLISLKTALDLGKAMLDAKGTIDQQKQVFELNRVILAAQESALSANEAQSALLKRIDALERKIADFETWESEKDRYRLFDVGSATGRPSVFVYALKENAGGAETLHYLCAKCFQHKKKSFLQATTRLEMRLRVHSCPECKSEFAFAPVVQPAPQR